MTQSTATRPGTHQALEEKALRPFHVNVPEAELTELRRRIQLADRLKAPVGYSFRGKQWLEHDNLNAVGMTGLLGYGEPMAPSMAPTSCCCSAR
jgi:thiamine pyrophosphate-dependent acetolactate synthase large subunit-like protein